MLNPETVLKLLKTDPLGSPLETTRFIRIAFFDTPDTPRIYNGLAAQLSGDDMYGTVLPLKTLEVSPNRKEFFADKELMSVAEWEWNGGEDLKGDQLREAKELYNNFLLSKINEEIARLSKELDETEESWRKGEIDGDSLDNIRYSIYKKAESLWLNQDHQSGRFPAYFEDLDVPDNLKDAFNDTFGDFSMTF